MGDLTGMSCISLVGDCATTGELDSSSTGGPSREVRLFLICKESKVASGFAPGGGEGDIDAVADRAPPNNGDAAGDAAGDMAGDAHAPKAPFSLPCGCA
mmetsp:Transcript_68856/g.124118  ORF Transcript_68856/g.124118 Transcript_68856/m.124118 type:complete len:99 (-) Transcript_68856:970-1266(-)